MRVVPGSCSLKLVPAQASSSVHIHAHFTMKPDLSEPSIIGQTAHNLDEVGRWWCMDSKDGLVA